MTNPARGEVEVEVGGETYVLSPTFGKMAKLQAALKVEDGIGPVLSRLIAFDAVALSQSVKCLAVKGDWQKLDDAPFEDIYDLQVALVKAIMGPKRYREFSEGAAGNAPSGETKMPTTIAESSLPADG